MNIIGTETALSLLYDNIRQANLSADVINDINVLSNIAFLNDDYNLLTITKNNNISLYLDDNNNNGNDDDEYDCIYYLAHDAHIINNSQIYDVVPYGIIKNKKQLIIANQNISSYFYDNQYNYLTSINAYSISFISCDAFILPEKIQYIDHFAFELEDNNNILSIIHPKNNSLKYIGESAFKKQKIQYIKLNSCNYIGKLAFYQCMMLSCIELPNNLQIIENDAFDNCISLSTVDLKNTQLEIINPFTFAHCSSLVSASFPSTLLSIDSFAFYDCPKLSAFDFTNVNPIKLQEQIFYSCASNYSIFVNEDKYNEWITLNSHILFNESNLSSHFKMLMFSCSK